MDDHELEQEPGNEAVKLLVERQAARELYDAVRSALGLAAISEDSAGANQDKRTDDPLFMIIRRGSATELLNVLAVLFGLSPVPKDKAPEASDSEDVVMVVVGKPTALVIVNAVTVGLGVVSPPGDADEHDGVGDVVEIVVSKFTAVDMLNALVINLGFVQPPGKAGKGGKGGLQEETGQGDDPPGGGGGDDPPLDSLPPSDGKENGTLLRDFSTEPADEVDCTAYAPGEASPGNSFLLQVFAHLPEQAAALEAIAKEADPNAKRRVGRTLDQSIKRGTRLTFNMTMPHLEVDEPSQSLIWRGKPASVQFAVSVPKDSEPRDITCTVVVAENSIPIGHLKFILKVVKGGAVAISDTPAVVANLFPYKQAFISYASADRAEVLKRVQILNASKVKFFQDLLTLEPGDKWEKLIYQYIDESDVFYLFWSKAASKSRWVKKEIAYARKRQAGKDEAPPEIVPILIEGPPPAKPPKALSFLHLNDKFLYFIQVEEELADGSG